MVSVAKPSKVQATDQLPHSDDGPLPRLSKSYGRLGAPIMYPARNLWRNTNWSGRNVHIPCAPNHCEAATFQNNDSVRNSVRYHYKGKRRGGVRQPAPKIMAIFIIVDPDLYFFALTTHLKTWYCVYGRTPPLAISDMGRYTDSTSYACTAACNELLARWFHARTSSRCPTPRIS